jgi:hypothetical protein
MANFKHYILVALVSAQRLTHYITNAGSVEIQPKIIYVG